MNTQKRKDPQLCNALMLHWYHVQLIDYLQLAPSSMFGKWGCTFEQCLHPLCQPVSSFGRGSWAGIFSWSVRKEWIILLWELRFHALNWGLECLWKQVLSEVRCSSEELSITLSTLRSPFGNMVCWMKEEEVRIIRKKRRRAQWQDIRWTFFWRTLGQICLKDVGGTAGQEN